MKPLTSRHLQTSIKRFASALPVPQEKFNHLVIIAPYGPSCVGKSTVMKYLAKRIPLVYIQHDGIRLFFRAKGIDENKYLYKHQVLFRIGELFLKKGYSVILDANFATHHQHVPAAKKLAKRYRARLFLIRVTAPQSYILRKLKRKKFLPTNRGGLLPNARVAIEHFLRSSKQFDYERLMRQTVAVVDSSKPLGSQLKRVISLVRKGVQTK